MQEPKTFIFFGSQGAGKGTQRKLLTKEFEKNNHDVLPFDSGATFRSFLSTDGYAQERIREITTNGHLLPHFVPTVFWGQAFMENAKEDTHILIDGSPRTVAEAELLDDAFTFFQRDSAEVIYLTLTEEEAVRRLTKRGREDDTPQAIKERLSAFKERTKPVLNFFSEKDRYMIHEVDGGDTIENIHEKIKMIAQM